MSIYAVVFPQYIRMNNQPNYDNSYVLRRNICACAEQRTDNNKNIATAIKKRPATVLSREAARRSRHTTGIVSTVRPSQRVDHTDRCSLFTVLVDDAHFVIQRPVVEICPRGRQRTDDVRTEIGNQRMSGR